MWTSGSGLTSNQFQGFGYRVTILYRTYYTSFSSPLEGEVEPFHSHEGSSGEVAFRGEMGLTVPKLQQSQFKDISAIAY